MEVRGKGAGKERGGWVFGGWGGGCRRVGLGFGGGGAEQGWEMTGGTGGARADRGRVEGLPVCLCVSERGLGGVGREGGGGGRVVEGNPSVLARRSPGSYGHTEGRGKKGSVQRELGEWAPAGK